MTGVQTCALPISFDLLLPYAGTAKEIPEEGVVVEARHGVADAPNLDHIDVHNRRRDGGYGARDGILARLADVLLNRHRIGNSRSLRWQRFLGLDLRSAPRESEYHEKDPA
mgnify:CR=1 FL=1